MRGNGKLGMKEPFFVLFMIWFFVLPLLVACLSIYFLILGVNNSGGLGLITKFCGQKFLSSAINYPTAVCLNPTPKPN
jgi:hypothetical protein